MLPDGIFGESEMCCGMAIVESVWVCQKMTGIGLRDLILN